MNLALNRFQLLFLLRRATPFLLWVKRVNQSNDAATRERQNRTIRLCVMRCRHTNATDEILRVQRRVHGKGIDRQQNVADLDLAGALRQTGRGAELLHEHSRRRIR